MLSIRKITVFLYFECVIFSIHFHYFSRLQIDPFVSLLFVVVLFICGNKTSSGTVNCFFFSFTLWYWEFVLEENIGGNEEIKYKEKFDQRIIFNTIWFDVRWPSVLRFPSKWIKWVSSKQSRLVRNWTTAFNHVPMMNVYFWNNSTFFFFDFFKIEMMMIKCVFIGQNVLHKRYGFQFRNSRLHLANDQTNHFKKSAW